MPSRTEQYRCVEGNASHNVVPISRKFKVVGFPRHSRHIVKYSMFTLSWHWKNREYVLAGICCRDGAFTIVLKRLKLLSFECRGTYLDREAMYNNYKHS